MKVFEWRDYQLKALAEIDRAIEKGSRGQFGVAECGAGKTVMYSEHSRKQEKQGHKVAILVPQEHLVDQTSETLEALGVRHGVIQACDSTDKGASVQVACAPSLKTREMPFKPTSIIIDEAHGMNAETYRSFIEEHDDALLLAVSATPIRMDNTGFSDVCDTMIQIADAHSLVNHHNGPYLMSPECYEGSVEVHEKVMNTKTRKGKNGPEYDKKESEKIMGEKEIVGDVVKEYLKRGEGMRGVIYANSIENSKKYAQAFLDHGIAAEHMDGDTGRTQRTGIFGRLKSGRTRIICNVNVLTYGWDEPLVGYIADVAPTQSLARYLQRAKRNMRMHPDKHKAIFVDQAQNWKTHGSIIRLREWDLNGLVYNPMAKKDRLCPRCECIMAGHLIECPNPSCDYRVFQQQCITKQAQGSFEKKVIEDPAITEYRMRLRWCHAHDVAFSEAWFQMIKQPHHEVENLRSIIRPSIMQKMQITVASEPKRKIK